MKVDVRLTTRHPRPAAEFGKDRQFATPPVMAETSPSSISSFSARPQTVEVKRSAETSSKCRKKKFLLKKLRHVSSLFRSNRWKHKRFWLDFYLNGLKPLYPLGFDRRFGYRAQPLREMVFCKGAKRKWTELS